MDALASDPGWVPVYADPVAVIFVRGSQQLRPLWSRLRIPERRVFETMYAEARRLNDRESAKTRAHLSMGQASLKLGELERAYGHYTTFLEHHPDDAEAKSIVEILRAQGFGH